MRKTLNEIEFFVRGDNPKSSIRGDLLENVKRPGFLLSSRKIFDEVALKSSLASFSSKIPEDEMNEVSYQQRKLSKEIDCFLSAQYGSSFNGNSADYQAKDPKE